MHNSVEKPFDLAGPGWIDGLSKLQDSSGSAFSSYHEVRIVVFENTDVNISKELGFISGENSFGGSDGNIDGIHFSLVLEFDVLEPASKL